VAGSARAVLNRPGADPAAFVASVGAGFDAAAARVGAIEVDHRIAGRAVRLRFAGSALVDPLTAALAHVASAEPGAPDVCVDVFDAASTGVSLPAPPWSWDAFQARGDIDGFTTETVKVAFDPGTSGLSVFDAATGRACWWVPNATQLPARESSAPLRTLFHWWFETIGLHLVHGAAVGHHGAGVLLAGAGGTGKSSTALACLQAGWSFVGDDYCVLDTRGEPAAHSVYCTAKVDDAARARLPTLAARPGIELAHRGKRLLRLWPEFAGQLAREVPIHAVLLPRIGAGPGSALRPASPTEVVRGIATSTMRQTPGAGASTWHAATAVARTVPAYVLTLGTDVDAIPDTSASVL